MPPTQSYANHSRYVPMYHYAAFGLLAINFLWAIKKLYFAPGGDTIVNLFTAFALLLLFYYVRVFPLAVQDRVIRLEERLRIARLAPDLAPRVEEFTRHQLVALRFAGDAELPQLARRVLEEKMTSRDAIKREIREWRGDDMRA